MKINFDTKKGASAVGNFFSKTADLSKKAVGEMQKSAAAYSEKSKEEGYQKRLKKYNPLFPDVYNSENFVLPGLLFVVSDSDRKDIDVCEGAIGWSSSEGIDAVYLYDYFAEQSSIKFVPALTRDSAYIADTYDKTRYIRTDCIFTKAHEERLAELKHIAYSLGAKKCSIEISETSMQSTAVSGKGSLGAGKLLKASGSTSNEAQQVLQRTGKITAEFEGSDTPKRPKLKWFSQDDNIKNLVDIRCKKHNAIKSETIMLSGSASSTMSQKVAVAIDTAITKVGIKGSFSMESQAIRESQSTLLFSLEF